MKYKTIYSLANVYLESKEHRMLALKAGASETKAHKELFQLCKEYVIQYTTMMLEHDASEAVALSKKRDDIVKCIIKNNLLVPKKHILFNTWTRIVDLFYLSWQQILWKNQGVNRRQLDVNQVILDFYSILIDSIDKENKASNSEENNEEKPNKTNKLAALKHGSEEIKKINLLDSAIRKCMVEFKEPREWASTKERKRLGPDLFEYFFTLAEDELIGNSNNDNYVDYAYMDVDEDRVKDDMCEYLHDFYCPELTDDEIYKFIVKEFGGFNDPNEVVTEDNNKLAALKNFKTNKAAYEIHFNPFDGVHEGDEGMTTLPNDAIQVQPDVFVVPPSHPNDMLYVYVTNVDKVDRYLQKLNDGEESDWSEAAIELDLDFEKIYEYLYSEDQENEENEENKSNKLAALKSFAPAADQNVFVFRVILSRITIQHEGYKSYRNISELADFFYNGDNREEYEDWTEKQYSKPKFESKLASGETIVMCGYGDNFFIGKNEEHVYKKFIETYTDFGIELDECKQIWNDAKYSQEENEEQPKSNKLTALRGYNDMLDICCFARSDDPNGGHMLQDFGTTTEKEMEGKGHIPKYFFKLVDGVWVNTNNRGGDYNMSYKQRNKNKMQFINAGDWSPYLSQFLVNVRGNFDRVGLNEILKKWKRRNIRDDDVIPNDKLKDLTFKQIMEFYVTGNKNI